MKRYLLGLIALVALTESYGQKLQASIGAGGNPSNIRIYLRPDITNPAVAISTLQFNVAIPASITPVPTLSLVTNNIAGTTWIIDPPYAEGGYLNYNIYNNQSLYTLNCSAGIEFQAMELSFTGGPAGAFPNSAHLVTLPDGGTVTFQGVFYCTSAIGGVLNSDGQSLYYARDANVSFANGDSYKNLPPGAPNRPLGTFTSYARLISAITLPVKFSSFTASRADNNGLLNWIVENQNAGISHFEIERSFTGADFVKIGTRNAVINGSNGNYNFTDGGVFNSYAGNVYYRIRQVDRNGEITYSAIRVIRADGKGFGLSLYPNPVVKEANVLFTLSEAKQVSLVITDASGKQYSNITMQAAKGMTQKNIDVSSLSAGAYIIRIVAGDETQTLSFVKSN